MWCGITDNNVDERHEFPDFFLNFRSCEVACQGYDTFHGNNWVEIYAEQLAVGHGFEYLQPTSWSSTEINHVVGFTDYIEPLVDIDEFVGGTGTVSVTHGFSIDIVFCPLRSHYGCLRFSIIIARCGDIM